MRRRSIRANPISPRWESTALDCYEFHNVVHGPPRRYTGTNIAAIFRDSRTDIAIRVPMAWCTGGMIDVQAPRRVLEHVSSPQPPTSASIVRQSTVSAGSSSGYRSGASRWSVRSYSVQFQFIHKHPTPRLRFHPLRELPESVRLSTQHTNTQTQQPTKDPHPTKQANQHARPRTNRCASLSPPTTTGPHHLPYIHTPPASSTTTTTGWAGYP